MGIFGMRTLQSDSHFGSRHGIMRLLVAVVASFLAVVAAGGPPKSLQGSIFFTSLPSGDLIRLDHCGVDGCDQPVTIAKGLATYGGLIPWNGSLLAALKSRLVVQVDPWCQDSSCPLKPLVDVERAIGPGDHGSFSLAGMAWCHDSIFLVFGGQTGASGVLRCANCSIGRDCTQGCSLVDGGAAPGKGPRQLSGFAAGAACVNDQILVVDNSNFRVQSIPATCTSAHCEIGTFTSGLKWPLGIAVVDAGSRVLVTLDEGIVSLGPMGTLLHKDWSKREDSGFLCEGEGTIFVASGGDGNVVSFDASCVGPNCTATLVWNSTGSSAKSGGAIAYMPRLSERQAEPTVLLV